MEIEIWKKKNNYFFFKTLFKSVVNLDQPLSVVIILILS